MFKITVDEHVHLALLENRFANDLHHVISSNREHIGRYLSFANEQTLEGTRVFVERSLRNFAAGTAVPCVMWCDGVLVGAMGLHLAAEGPAASIGYWLAEDYQGRGIVTKCCRALLDYAFDELGLHRIEIRAVTHNRKSRAIPERLGFTREGILRGTAELADGLADSAVYGMLAPEWRLKRG